RQAPLERHPALVRQQDRQRIDRGHQQLGASRQGQGTRLSHYPKPQGNGLPARWKTRHAALSLRSFLSTPNSEEPKEASNASGCVGPFSSWQPRQSEVKGRAPSGVSRCPEAATMRLHNGTADCQPHAGALRFGRKERIENLVGLFGRQSHTGVADREQRVTSLAQFRLNRKFTACFLHRLDAV